MDVKNAARPGSVQNQWRPQTNQAADKMLSATQTMESRKLCPPSDREIFHRVGALRYTVAIGWRLNEMKTFAAGRAL